MESVNEFQEFIRNVESPSKAPSSRTMNAAAYSLESFHRIGHLAAALSFMVILFTGTVFFLMVFTRFGNKFALLKRPRFIPRANSAVAQLLSLTVFIRLLMTIIALMRVPEEEQTFYLTLWSINAGLFAAFVILYVFFCDVASAISTAVLVLIVALVEVSYLDNPDNNTSYCALLHLGSVLYWLMGSGKFYLQAEMKKAMQELQADTAAKAPSKRDRRRGGK
jgi:hypothetical protein